MSSNPIITFMCDRKMCNAKPHDDFDGDRDDRQLVVGLMDC